MSNSDSRDIHFGEHTFGRDHFTPPLLASELGPQGDNAPVSASSSSLPDDFDQRIRNIGEW